MRGSIISPALAIAAALGLSLPPAKAADAAFSADGREFCWNADGERELRIGPTAAGAQAAVLPSNFVGRVLAVAASSADGWLLLNAQGVWRRRPGAGEFELWLRGDFGSEFAVDPKTQNIFFGRPLRLYVRAEGKLRPVFSRRVDQAVGPSFSPDGELFFGHRGDLWRGTVERESADVGEPEGRSRAVLTAQRLAPLADLETGVGNSASTGVREVLATATHLFVHEYRMGVSGWGWIVRLRRPRPLGEVDPSAAGPGVLWKQTAEFLGQAEVLGAQARTSFLAATPAGRVVYRLEDPERFVLHPTPGAAAGAWK